MRRWMILAVVALSLSLSGCTACDRGKSGATALSDNGSVCVEETDSIPAAGSGTEHLRCTDEAAKTWEGTEPSVPLDGSISETCIVCPDEGSETRKETEAAGTEPSGEKSTAAETVEAPEKVKQKETERLQSTVKKEKTEPPRSTEDMEETEPTQNTEQNRETNPRQPGSGPQEETDPSTAEETEEPMPKDSAADDTSAHEHQWEEHSVIVREAWEERVLIREAWDETVVEHPAYDETIVAQEAWEEPVFEEHTFCSACGLDLTEAGISRGDHAEEAHDYNSGFTIRKVRVGTVFHEAVYEEVHHEEETQTVHHEAEYETITHEAVCRTAWICSLCGEEREP